ncbi:solute carrier family 15 member 1-like isoform X2, partial [Gryllus bimaculatus]
APKSMKTFAIAAWYATMAIGNLIVVVITETGLFTNQAHEYFFYATFMIFDMVIFLVMSRSYKFVDPDYSVSSDETTESIPLLPMQSKMPEELLQLVD